MNKWDLINQDSGEKTWLTPKHIIDALGHFDTDPCCPDNMPWRTADRMITKAEDGRTAEWKGRVWLNPPYGREAYPFLERMAHYEGGGYRAHLRQDGCEAMARLGIPRGALHPFHARAYPVLQRERRSATVVPYAFGARRVFGCRHGGPGAQRHKGAYRQIVDKGRQCVDKTARR